MVTRDAENNVRCDWCHGAVNNHAITDDKVMCADCEATFKIENDISDLIEEANKE